MAEKKKRGILVWATGISGCGGKRHLKNWQKYCAEQGKKVKIYRIGDMLVKWLWENLRIVIPPETILNADPDLLNAARVAVLDRILLSSLDGDLEENDAVVILAHTAFYWRGCYTPIYNEPFVLQCRPDVFVCFIDAAADILRVLNKRNQWKPQDLCEKDIWLWQNNEVDNTRRHLYLFDSDAGKKFFVMPVKQPAQTLHDLLFEPWRPIIYAQMPISHVRPDELEKVKWFIEQLWRQCVVFDPLTIETGVVEHSDSPEIRIRHNQTAHRDLEWFIPQCDIAIAYWVKIVCSPGVVDETAKASQKGKEAWVIFPGDHSPFIQYRAMPDRIFQTPEEVLEFLEKAYMPRIYKQWNIEQREEK